MNKIQYEGNDFSFNFVDLPLLIHGEDKAGASLFTITVATDLFLKEEKIVFLSGYSMGREVFFAQIGENKKVPFFIKEEVSHFIDFIKNDINVKDKVVIIKNIELFSEEILDLVLSCPKLIISGDINKCQFKSKILEINFNTKVFFSAFENVVLPKLDKYQGFLKSNSMAGKVFVSLLS